MLRDDTAAFMRGGYVLVQGPGDPVLTTEANREGERIWLRVRLGSGAYPSRTPPEIDALRPNRSTRNSSPPSTTNRPA